MSEGVEWAVHTCGVLADVPEGSTLSVARLAELHDVLGPYLAKHMQALSRAGIVESVPGRRGGYRLARPAAEVSILEIVEAVESSTRAFVCTDIRKQGPCAVDASCYSPVCSIAAVMYEAEEAWRTVLATTSVADINDRAEVSEQAARLYGQWMRDALGTVQPRPRRAREQS